MRKFLKVCHIISRVLVFLCVAAAIALLFFRPEGLGFGPVPPTADGSFWRVFATTLGFAAVMFAASDWAYRLLEDNDFLQQLSASILKPAFARNDLSDRRFHKTASDELDFIASLRTVSDERERTLLELAWEKKNNKHLQKKTVGHGIISLVFFVLALLFLVYPIAFYFVRGQVLALPGADLQAYFAVAAVVLTFIIIFDYTGYQKAQRRLNTVLSIRERCDEFYESERAGGSARPKPLAALAEAVTSPAAAEAAPAQTVPEPAVPEAEAQAEPEEKAEPEMKPEKTKRFGRKNKKKEATAPVILPEEAPAGNGAAESEPFAAPAETGAEPAPAASEVQSPVTVEAAPPSEPKESPFESLVPEEEHPES